MPHISQMLQSKHLTRSDIESTGQRFVPVTIRTVSAQQFRGRNGGPPETAWFIYFNEAQKGMKLNSTNIKALAAAFGEQTEAWHGKKVRLYVDPTVQFGGQTVGGIRIQTPNAAAVTQNAFGAPAAGQPAPAGAFGRQAPSSAFGGQPAPAGGSFDPNTGLIREPGQSAPRSETDPEFDDDIPF